MWSQDVVAFQCSYALHRIGLQQRISITLSAELQVIVGLALALLFGLLASNLNIKGSDYLDIRGSRTSWIPDALQLLKRYMEYRIALQKRECPRSRPLFCCGGKELCHCEIVSTSLPLSSSSLEMHKAREKKKQN